MRDRGDESVNKGKTTDNQTKKKIYTGLFIH